MRGTWVYRDGELIPKHLAAPLVSREARSAMPAPMLIRDGMEGLVGQHDGKVYESKSALRRSYKDHGLTELGNDAPLTPKAPPRPSGMREDVGQAIAKVKAGYKPEIDTSEL